MGFRNLPVFSLFFLLVSPTFARNVNDPPSSYSSSKITEFEIKQEKVPNNIRSTTEELTKDVEKIIKNIQSTISATVKDVERNDKSEQLLLNKNENIDNEETASKISNDNNENVKFIPTEKKFSKTENKDFLLEKSRVDSTPESIEKRMKNEPRFVKVMTIDGGGNSEIDSRAYNPYNNKSDDNISKILLYPVNGTTVVYRETTFKPILQSGIIEKTKQANNGEDNTYLPFTTRSKVIPDIIEKLNPNDEDEGITTMDENVQMSNDADIIEAANLGLEAMNDLYYIKEPKLFSMGLFLSDDNPGRYVAAFNDQTEEAKQLARFGYAALEGARSFVNKHPEFSRSETFVKDTRRTALHRQCPRRGIPPCPPASLRYRTADGSCNNPKELWWGSAMSSMQRFLQPVYQDGIQTIRRSVNGRLLPSPREISSFIHQDHDIPLASVTHMLMQWGQFVDHDLTATGQGRGFNGTVPQCCLNGGASFQPPEFMHPECLPISVPSGDEFYGPLGVRCLEFVRSGPAPREDCGFGPREQLFQVTSYLDASTVYSSNIQQSDSLRLFRNGLLQYGRMQSRKPLLPRQESDLCRRGSLSTNCFRAGDGRLTEQPALISMHVIFLRQHNRIATELAALNPHWSDEKLYQETRRIIGALIQHITYREFLPIVLGPKVIEAFDLEVKRKGYYDGYDPTVNPNIANAFAAAAYRFGHSLVQHSFVRYDTSHRPIFNNVTLHDEFSNPVNLDTAGSVDRMLLGLINQPSQKRDEFITKELTNHLFQTSHFRFGMDLASLNIQRGRDHGLPPYVDWREPCGLSPIRNWNDLERVMPSSAAKKFRILYSSILDIDLFPAGLAEKPVPGGLVGPTFACIIAQQFSNLRKGDRFWYENPNKENSFTPAQLQQIKRVTLSQIICRTAESIETIQPFVFLTPDTFRNERIPCDSEFIGALDLEPWAERAPPQQRSKSKVNNRSRGNIRNKIKDVNPPEVSEEVKKLGEIRARADKTDEKSLLQFFKPSKPGINQQNRVIIRQPTGTHENLTIVVQNHAVNSPVFVTETISGSNFQFTQSNDDHHYSSAPSHKPSNHGSNSKPVKRPTIHGPSSPRPIYYDDTESNPVSIPQTSYGPTPKPKPKPPSYGNPAPYIPHGINDPSNPNPMHYGFSARPTNNYAPSNSFFDTFSHTTTQRPTLYTFYTTFKRPTVTQRPSSYYHEEIRPQHDANDHDDDDSYSSQPNVGYGGSDPVTRPVYEITDDVHPSNSQSSWTHRPLHDQTWSSENSYDQNIANRPIQSNPSHDKPSYGKPGNGYWADYSTTTKNYPSADSYYDQEYQIENSQGGINPRPFKKQSLTIVTESDTKIHHPYNNQRVQSQNKHEIPKPFQQTTNIDNDESDIAEHKNSYEIEVGKNVDNNTKPGQFYYEKNILHRYPVVNSTSNENINSNQRIASYNNNPHDQNDVKIDKIVIANKYQLERLDPNRGGGGGPGPQTDTENKAQVTRDEIKLTTTSTIVLDDNDDDYDVQNYQKDKDNYENYDDVDKDEEITAAYSENVEEIVAPDITMSPIEWVNEKENSSLISNPEQPNLLADELISTREIPKPLRQQRKTGS